MKKLLLSFVAVIALGSTPVVAKQQPTTTVPTDYTIQTNIYRWENGSYRYQPNGSDELPGAYIVETHIGNVWHNYHMFKFN